MKKRSLLILITILFLASFAYADSRGINLVIKGDAGKSEKIKLYTGSYALLIGVSEYTNGWPDLESIPSEISLLENKLIGNNYKVVKVINPDSQSLKKTIEDFVGDYGYDKDNRLIFYFAGHGYSRKNGDKGYIIPADTPIPTNDEKGFLKKAVEMGTILTWAKQIESKHVLFLFDSCFSGTVFKSRALPKEPPHITKYVEKPVRQFITAGSAGEEVPAKSVFLPTLIKAMNGDGDLDGDGYVTGTELGMYVSRQVQVYESNQTPQYGKIRDPELDQGDFILLAPDDNESQAEILNNKINEVDDLKKKKLELQKKAYEIERAKVRQNNEKVIQKANEEKEKLKKENAELEKLISTSGKSEITSRNSNDIVAHLDDKYSADKIVKNSSRIAMIETNVGNIEIELYQEKAPLSVENFLSYAKSGFYNGTVFHRVIKNFMIQGGGLTDSLIPKPTLPPIKNEAGNGLKNLRGTIATARTGVVDSATSQFFINTVDNTFLDHRDNTQSGFGYAVFGKVVSGMEIVDRIQKVRTGKKQGFSDVPLESVKILRVSEK